MAAQEADEARQALDVLAAALAPDLTCPPPSPSSLRLLSQTSQLFEYYICACWGVAYYSR